MSLTLLSFTPGTTIYSSQVNSNFAALSGIMNGTTAVNANFVSTSNATLALLASLPTTPGSDQPVLGTNVSGDATPRVAQYVRSSDGYGGIGAGVGAAFTAHMFAQATGFMFQEGVIAGSFGSLYQLVIANSAPGSPITNQTLWVDLSVSL